MRRNFLLIVVLLFFTQGHTVFGQSNTNNKPNLTVARIMQDPATWIGAWPQNAYWTEMGDALYFNWNPGGQFPSDSLFRVDPQTLEAVQVSPAERRQLPPRFSGWRHGKHIYDAGFTHRVYSQGGDLFIYNRDNQQISRLTQTLESESNPRFSAEGNAVIFQKGTNLFKLTPSSGLVVQLTDLVAGQAAKESDPTPKEAFLDAQQTYLFDHIKEEEREQEERSEAREKEAQAEAKPPRFHTGKKRVRNLTIDPTERFVAFTLSSSPPRQERTLVQDYVTESGYAEDLNARPKVGGTFGTTTLYVQDLYQDTTYAIDLHQLPGSYDLPDYKQEAGAQPDSITDRRALIPTYVDWHPASPQAVIQVRARDNKDRWLASLDPATGTLNLLDRQRDEAWIAGPGISRYQFGFAEGWLPDNQHYFFQSEKTGYSHLYMFDTKSGKTKALTSGPFEIFSPMLSQDGARWFFTSSEGSPHERHFYSMPLMGGERTRLTQMPGNNQVRLAPDETTLGMVYSYSNRPPEIYIQPAGQNMQQVTASPSEAWQTYPWRDPEIVQFEASDGVKVPARLYAPENPNGAAVLFVHGAGYLQNVHRWWSSYYREYMFHNLLTDLGYTVLDVDYRASAGYGRDWRTAIYRHMGGRDLQDFVDASRYINKTKNIDPERVFIYGGSYGGFITLMALFTEPEHFGGGAALRSVTDWAHYNHGYTSNILNTPAEDSLAYARSSPIYFAEGLEDPLLIAHGMVDTNVHFQDVVRLAQRLIELGKEDWEMAVYPIEGHGFQTPTSWTDEYRRILELIEASVGPNSTEASAEEP
ncbi:MAG: prolyl oligopeptidase family serine peptidase [Bacteroidota bacterium]